MFEFGSNWYVRGELGISFDQASSVSFSSIALPPLGVVPAPFTTGPARRTTLVTLEATGW
jgi:hypothetical protein